MQYIVTNNMMSSWLMGFILLVNVLIDHYLICWILLRCAFLKVSLKSQSYRSYLNVVSNILADFLFCRNLHVDANLILYIYN